MNEDLSSLENFGGTARLFPLPNLVLFPHVMQPLHIFEPRYRQMTTDALAGDRLIALALLQPGWEADYEGRPALFPVACLGKVVAEQRLADGRFNILLRGLTRIRLGAEIDLDKLYRTARVEILADADAPEGEAEHKLRRQMSKLVPTWFPSQGAVLDQFHKLLQSALPLGALCDIIAFALPLDLEVKQELLEEVDVGRRLRRLLRHLKKNQPPAVAADRKFPPEFSDN
jgi:Lon protease-like protein